MAWSKSRNFRATRFTSATETLWMAFTLSSGELPSLYRQRLGPGHGQPEDGILLQFRLRQFVPFGGLHQVGRKSFLHILGQDFPDLSFQRGGSRPLWEMRPRRIPRPLSAGCSG